jgi:hypothetical protein
MTTQRNHICGKSLVNDTSSEYINARIKAEHSNPAITLPRQPLTNAGNTNTAQA